MLHFDLIDEEEEKSFETTLEHFTQEEAEEKPQSSKFKDLDKIYAFFAEGVLCGSFVTKIALMQGISILVSSCILLVLTAFALGYSRFWITKTFFLPTACVGVLFGIWIGS